jgi:hypothetical protein
VLVDGRPNGTFGEFDGNVLADLVPHDMREVSERELSPLGQVVVMLGDDEHGPLGAEALELAAEVVECAVAEHNSPGPGVAGETG